jgi:hypothetical protein
MFDLRERLEIRHCRLHGHNWHMQAGNRVDVDVCARCGATKNHDTLISKHAA